MNSFNQKNLCKKFKIVFSKNGSQKKSVILPFWREVDIAKQTIFCWTIPNKSFPSPYFCSFGNVSKLLFFSQWINSVVLKFYIIN